MQYAIRSYRRAGLSVLPAIPVQKRPALSGWKRYQQQLPSDAEVEAWAANKLGGLCLVCGRVSGNLELIDFDHGGQFYGPWCERVGPALLERLVIERSQSGGMHAVYRCTEPVGGNAKLAQAADGRVMIETRGEGGLFLCAPTPGYELIQGDLAELPVLTTQERAVLIEAAKGLNQAGDGVHVESIQGCTLSPTAPCGRPGDDYNQRGDLRALLVKHGWRPAGCRSDGNEHWTRAGKSSGTSATLRENTLYVFSSSAAPFEPNRGYSPFAVYALLEHNGDFEAATRDLSGQGYGNDTPSTDVDLSGLLPKIVENEKDSEPKGDTSDSAPFSSRLLEVPGFIGEMSRFITETNYTHQPILSLAGAIALQGLLAGRKVRDPSNTRTNIYLLGVAETCCGKERARTVCKELLSAHGDSARAKFFERPASYQGVQKKVLRQPQCLLLWDEIGQSLRAFRNADRSPHLQGILRTITEMFTSAGSVYCSDTHSDDRDDFTIVQPNLVVYGTSTPDELFAGLTTDSIQNGFCGRMILFEGDNDPKDLEQDELPPLPKSLVEATGDWLNFIPPGNDLNGVHPKPVIVPRTSKAKEVLASLLEQQRGSRKHADSIHRALWGRAVQKANQLALIYACSKYGPDQDRLQIDPEAAEWARDIVEHTTKRLIHLASTWIADDEFHGRQNEVMRFIESKGGAVSRNQLTRRFQRWSARVRNEVFQNLMETGQMTIGGNPQKNGRGTWYYTPRAILRSSETST